MRFLIAVPVYNEARTLSGVLSAVARSRHDVLVIDDGSTDGTPGVLRRHSGLSVITHPENRGYGQSVIDAFAFASLRGYDWVITIDCDEQHEPAQIPEFVACARRGLWDVVSGSRYLRAFPDDDDPPTDRREINRAINNLLRQMLGLCLTDSFCGFKAYRVRAVQQLALDEPGYAFPLQFWVQCARAGLRIRELPVRRIYRDKSRTFGGTLDDPAARLQHYLAVFLRELARGPVPPSRRLLSACGCRQPG